MRRSTFLAYILIVLLFSLNAHANLSIPGITALGNSITLESVKTEQAIQAAKEASEQARKNPEDSEKQEEAKRKEEEAQKQMEQLSRNTEALKDLQSRAPNEGSHQTPNLDKQQTPPQLERTPTNPEAPVTPKNAETPNLPDDIRTADQMTEDALRESGIDKVSSPEKQNSGTPRESASATETPPSQKTTENSAQNSWRESLNNLLEKSQNLAQDLSKSFSPSEESQNLAARIAKDEGIQSQSALQKAISAPPTAEELVSGLEARGEMAKTIAEKYGVSKDVATGAAQDILTNYQLTETMSYSDMVKTYGEKRANTYLTSKLQKAVSAGYSASPSLYNSISPGWTGPK